MKKNFSSSNRKYIALILGVVGAALLLSVLFKDKLDVTLIGKVTTNPTDKEENLNMERPIIRLRRELFRETGSL